MPFVFEAKINTEDRNKLPDSAFGLPSKRKYPLTDAEGNLDKKHVLQAVRFFNKADDEDKPELAKNILKAAKELDMDYSNWKDVLEAAGEKVVKEYSSCGDDDDDADYEEHEPDDCYCESGDINGLVNINMIASKIHEKCEEDEPDNNNCLLCSWCAESWMRGHELLPRPVYSPRDPALEIFPEDVINDRLEYFKLNGGFNVLIAHLESTDTSFGRWYCHVKWGDGHGGHEFLVVKTDGKFYVMDAQAGIVEPITEKCYYFKDIVWEQSYICRIDDKEFNYEKFKEINDPKNTIPWNGTLDIPYMLDEGMLTEDEAEKYWEEHPDEKPVQESCYIQEFDHNSTKIPVNNASFDKLYFGSPTRYEGCIELDRPLFVSPYMAISSIFTFRDLDIQNRTPKGIYNLKYEEWLNASNYDLTKPFKDVHVYVEGYPELEPYEIENTGYIHVIDGHEYSDRLCRYDWMDDNLEYLIDNSAQNEVHIDNVIECTVRYHVSGIASDNPRLGPLEKTGQSPVQESKMILKSNDSRIPKLMCEGWKIAGTTSDNEYILIQEGYDDISLHISLIPASKADIPNMEEWEYECMKDAYPNRIIPENEVDKLKEELHQDAIDSVWKTRMIQYDGTTIGMLTAYKVLDDEWWFIAEIYLIPEYRGKGIAKYILQQEIDQHDKLILNVYQSNTHAIELYESLGFEITQDGDGRYIMELDKTKKSDIFESGVFAKYGKDVDLRNARGPIQESHTNLLDETFYRFEYDGEGIYEALRKNMPMDDWKAFKQSEAATWLPVPPNYQTGDQSFFTKNGYEKFMDLTYPYMTKYLKKSKIRKFESELNPKYIRYRDEYQVVFNKTKPIQESFIQEGYWQDIKNGVNPKSKKLWFHISFDDKLDDKGPMAPRIPSWLEEVKKDGYTTSEGKKTHDLDEVMKDTGRYENYTTPRVCFSPSIEGALNSIINMWKLMNKDFPGKQLYVYIPEKPISQYKHKTNKELIRDKEVFDAGTTGESWILEPVKVKFYGTIKIDKVKDNGRRHKVITRPGYEKENDFIGRFTYKWHWLIHPSILKQSEKYEKSEKHAQSPMEVCKDIVSELKNFKYGIVKDGKLSTNNSIEDYNKYYKFMTLDEFEKYRGGICYDYVEWEEAYLKDHGKKYKKYYLYADTKNNDTHTFILVKNANGLIYLESAFKPLEGTYEVKDLQEALDIMTKEMFKMNGNDKLDSFKYYVWQYEGHPEYGSSIKQTEEYFSKGEPILEGTAINPKKGMNIK